MDIAMLFLALLFIGWLLDRPKIDWDSMPYEDENEKVKKK